MWPRSKAARTRPGDSPAPVKMEELTLDPDTAHPLLEIPADGKEVRCGSFMNTMSSSPRQSDTANCVVAKQSFSAGQHYWEVYVGQKPHWNLGVVSERAERRSRLIQMKSLWPGSGEVCVEGYWLISYNQQKPEKPYWAFDINPMPFDCNPRPQTIGVYLDYPGGEVTFYNTDDPCDLIPLYSQRCLKQHPCLPRLRPLLARQRDQQTSP